MIVTLFQSPPPQPGDEATMTVEVVPSLGVSS